MPLIALVWLAISSIMGAMPVIAAESAASPPAATTKSPAAPAEKSRPESIAPSIMDLAWLIGTWAYSDESVTPGVSYRDAGTRRCAWTLSNAYIRCESEGMVGTKRRNYVFYFNYNALEKRFEMLAMHGDYPRKSQYEVVVEDGGRRLELRGSPILLADGGTSRSWATVTFDGDATMRWETRINRSNQRPDHWPLRFADVAKRVN